MRFWKFEKDKINELLNNTQNGGSEEDSERDEVDDFTKKDEQIKKNDGKVEQLAPNLDLSDQFDVIGDDEDIHLEDTSMDELNPSPSSGDDVCDGEPISLGDAPMTELKLDDFSGSVDKQLDGIPISELNPNSFSGGILETQIQSSGLASNDSASEQSDGLAPQDDGEPNDRDSSLEEQKQGDSIGSDSVLEKDTLGELKGSGEPKDKDSSPEEQKQGDSTDSGSIPKEETLGDGLEPQGSGEPNDSESLEEQKQRNSIGSDEASEKDTIGEPKGSEEPKDKDSSPKNQKPGDSIGSDDISEKDTLGESKGSEEPRDRDLSLEEQKQGDSIGSDEVSEKGTIGEPKGSGESKDRDSSPKEQKPGDSTESGSIPKGETLRDGLEPQGGGEPKDSKSSLEEQKPSDFTGSDSVSKEDGGIKQGENIDENGIPIDELNHDGNLSKEELEQLRDKLLDYDKKKKEEEERRKLEKHKLLGTPEEVSESSEEKYELSEHTNQFLEQLQKLPSFKDRSRGAGYPIDTSYETEVSDSIIKTLISKFLNRRFCKRKTDLNVRSNSLKKTQGLYKWEVKDVIKDLKTHQVTKVLTDKYGYEYASGKNESVPLSFYFDMSGSMSSYTNLLAVIAIELLKKNVKVLVGFNERVNVQIESIKKGADISELAGLLESAGYSTWNVGSAKSRLRKNSVFTFKFIDRNLDNYLIEKEAEKCVVFADFDPVSEVCNLSNTSEVYWFCFEEDFSEQDLSKFRGFLYKVQDADDIASGLIKVNEHKFEVLCYIDNPKELLKK